MNDLMSEKIIRKVLENASLNVDAVVLLINISGNPEVALEMLLGLYEAPEVPTKVSEVVLARYPELYAMEFIHYDPFKQEVTYKCIPRVSISYWIPKGGDIPAYADANDTRFLSVRPAELAKNVGMDECRILEEYRQVTIYGDAQRTGMSTNGLCH